MAHLTSFTVENFKRFEHFEMQNIGQFNLIVGDNNVGKTSVLEALLIDEESEVFRLRLLKVLTEFRGFDQLRDSFWYYFIPRQNALNNLKPTNFYGVTQGTISIVPSNEYGADKWLWQNSVMPQTFSLSNDKTIRYNRTLRYDGTGLIHVPLIPFAQGYFHGLTRIYSAYFQRNRKRKDKLIEGLRTVVPDIDGIDIDTASAQEPVIFISQANSPTTIPLALFGDGTLKLLRILLEIGLHENQRLMIDEIDAGIHISHSHNFWRTILLAAKEAKVQLFMTTHNWECLQVFKEVLKEPEMAQYQEKARCFKLAEMPDGSVKSYSATFEEFQSTLESGFDPREVWQ